MIKYSVGLSALEDYKRYEIDLDKFENVRRWFDELKTRPAVKKGMDVGKDNRTFEFEQN